MDIALVFQPGNTGADIVIENLDVQVDKDLQSAIIISLFCNRLCDKSDVLDGEDRQGFWGDSYSEVPGSLTGSKLWLLRRTKLTQEIANLAKQYCIEALQWLVEDKVADSVIVDTKITPLNELDIFIQVIKPTGIKNFRFPYVWSQI